MCISKLLNDSTRKPVEVILKLCITNPPLIPIVYEPMKLKSKQEIREKKKRIAEKLAIRNLKKKTKKQFARSKLIKEADRVLSLYIRKVRDKDKPCITC